MQPVEHFIEHVNNSKGQASKLFVTLSVSYLQMLPFKGTEYKCGNTINDSEIHWKERHYLHTYTTVTSTTITTTAATGIASRIGFQNRIECSPFRILCLPFTLDLFSSYTMCARAYWIVCCCNYALRFGMLSLLSFCIWHSARAPGGNCLKNSYRSPSVFM